jgi:hypothetical protein
MLVSFNFRGEDVDLDVTSESEPYEWVICGMTTEQYNALNVTADEEAAMAAAIGEALYDRAVKWCPEDG